MTWHAARFILLECVILAIAAAGLFLVFTIPHRGRYWLHAGLGERTWIPRGLRWHFHRDHRSWLRVAIGTILVIGCAVLFTNLTRNVLTDATLAKADVRLHNTLRMFVSEDLHRRYSAITRLASSGFVLPALLVLALALMTAGRRREALFLGISFFLAVVFAVVLKYLVDRPRPPDARVFMKGPSFPSGHTLTAATFYGFIAYLLLRDEVRRWWRLLAVVPLLLVVIVPLSRIYLGVHWPSDTFASLVIGAGLLAATITAFKFPPFEKDIANRDPSPYARMTVVASIIALLVYGAWYATASVERESRPPRLQPASTIALSALTTFPSRQKTSEDLTGGPMEPAVFVFVGTAQQIRIAFAHAGWVEAETPSATGLLHELACVIRDAPDPNGPATPSYFAAQAQDLTFEKPGTASGSIRHRHHIRIWQMPVLVAPDVPVWAATCSYDEGVEIVPKPYIVTHRIDPNVDKERELIDQQLRGAGARELAFIVVTGASRGRNAGGDDFFTDGRAHVLLMPGARG